MLALPDVAERVAANGGELEATLGHLDSAKELLLRSATLRLFDTQARLAEVAGGPRRAADPVPRRGGAVVRGSGSTAPC